jgi:tripartite-type tricarboxylate transporter receptor subunit TctC
MHRGVPHRAPDDPQRGAHNAEADGYTLLLGGGSGMIMAPLVMKVPYDPVKDFKSVAMLTRQMQAIAVHPSVPANNLRELVALIKANPGKYSYATSGLGGSDHLTAELFKQTAGNLDLLHVPYKGGAPAMRDVVAGQVPILITALSGIHPYWKSGQIRLLAVTGAKRSTTAPEIPTAVEAGVPGLVAETCNFLTAPARTPAPVIETLRAAVAKIMADPAFIGELVSLGWEPVTESTPERTDEYVKGEIEKWRQVVIAAKVAPE